MLASMELGVGIREVHLVPHVLYTNPSSNGMESQM